MQSGGPPLRNGRQSRQPGELCLFRRSRQAGDDHRPPARGQRASGKGLSAVKAVGINHDVDKNVQPTPAAATSQLNSPLST